MQDPIFAAASPAGRDLGSLTTDPLTNGAVPSAIAVRPLNKRGPAPQAHGSVAERPGRSTLRTTGRVGRRRATSRKPARSYIDFAPKNMSSGWLRSSLSTG